MSKDDHKEKKHGSKKEQPKKKINIRDIEKFKKSVCCQKNFSCLDKGFENICKAEDGGPLGTVYCLEENSQKCLFSMTWGYEYLCKCPLRVYILKEFKK